MHKPVSSSALQAALPKFKSGKHEGAVRGSCSLRHREPHTTASRTRTSAASPIVHTQGKQNRPRDTICMQAQGQVVKQLPGDEVGLEFD